MHVEMTPAGGRTGLVPHRGGEVRGARLEEVGSLVQLGAPRARSLR